MKTVELAALPGDIVFVVDGARIVDKKILSVRIEERSVSYLFYHYGSDHVKGTAFFTTVEQAVAHLKACVDEAAEIAMKSAGLWLPDTPAKPLRATKETPDA